MLRTRWWPISQQQTTGRDQIRTERPRVAASEGFPFACGHFDGFGCRTANRVTCCGPMRGIGTAQ
jgi:hypothetical protein